MSENKEVVKPEVKKGTVLIFPVIKKIQDEIKLDPDDEPSIIARNLAYMTEHYTEQMTSYLLNHGIEDSLLFRKDIEFLRQVMDSTLARAMGQHHPLQTYIDELNEEE